jgi:hypothetical protein
LADSTQNVSQEFPAGRVYVRATLSITDIDAEYQEGDIILFTRAIVRSYDMEVGVSSTSL